MVRSAGPPTAISQLAPRGARARVGGPALSKSPVVGGGGITPSLVTLWFQRAAWRCPSTRGFEMTTKTAPVLSATQLSEVIGLIKGADTVELKLTVPDSDRASAVAALGMDSLDAEIRQIMFFDTPDLKLNQQGVVVRARRIQRKPGDSVVKLRPVVPDDLSPKLRKSPNFGVEVDAMPGGFVCSASMKFKELDPIKVKEGFTGERRISKLFSKEQRDFYTAHAPDGLELDDLSMLGPITIMKLKFTPGDFGRKMVAELWFYPNGSRILELSTKCAPAEAFTVSAEAKAFLTGHGVDLAGQQQTKTKSALDFFVRQLKDAPQGSPRK